MKAWKTGWNICTDRLRERMLAGLVWKHLQKLLTMMLIDGKTVWT